MDLPVVVAVVGVPLKVEPQVVRVDVVVMAKFL
jgi:hypothetical protein